MNFRAYSLIQLLVSLGLGAVILAASAYAITQLIRSMRFESAKRELSESAMLIERTLREDIKSAIRVLPTPAFDRVGYRAQDDTFFILKDNLLSSIPVGSMSLKTGALQMTLTRNNSIPEEVEVTNLLIDHLTSHSNLIVVGGQEEKYLFQEPASNVSTSGDDVTLMLDGHAHAAQFLTTNNYPTRISFPRDVQWIYDRANKKLSRMAGVSVGLAIDGDSRTKFDYPLEIEELEVFYRFENHDRDSTLIVPSAGYSLTSPNDEYWGDPISPWVNCFEEPRPGTCRQCQSGGTSDGAGGFKCVGWEHLAEATFRIKFKGDRAVRGDLDQAALAGGYALEDGRLALTKVFSQKFDGYFRSSATDTLSVSDPTCSVPRPYYCDPDRRCDPVFTSSDRTSPFWKGYKLGGDWCECATPVGSSTAQLNWEAQMIPHGFGTAAGKAKLEACARVQPCSIHNGNNSYDTARVHPAHWLACSCILPTLNDAGHVVQKAIYERENEGLNSFPSRPLVPNEYDWRDWDDGVDPMIDQAQDRNINCSVYRGGNSCLHAARALSTDGASLWGGVDRFLERCQCFNQRVDYLERPLGQMWAHIRDWKAVCGDESFDFGTPGNTIACPDSMEQLPSGESRQWDPDSQTPGGEQTTYYQYKPYVYEGVEDPDNNVQGMQPDNLRMCYCLKGAVPQGYGHPRWVLWHGSDVRTGSAIYPDPPNEGVQERHLAHKVWHEDLGEIDCAAIARSWFDFHGTPGWCVEDAPHMSEALFESRMIDLRGSPPDPDETAMRNFCSNKCKNFTDWQSRRAAIRRTITRSPTDGDLPNWCGGGGGGPGGSPGGGGGG